MLSILINPVMSMNAIDKDDQNINNQFSFTNNTFSNTNSNNINNDNDIADNTKQDLKKDVLDLLQEYVANSSEPLDKELCELFSSRGVGYKLSNGNTVYLKGDIVKNTEGDNAFNIVFSSIETKDRQIYNGNGKSPIQKLLWDKRNNDKNKLPYAEELPFAEEESSPCAYDCMSPNEAAEYINVLFNKYSKLVEALNKFKAKKQINYKYLDDSSISNSFYLFDMTDQRNDFIEWTLNFISKLKENETFSDEKEEKLNLLIYYKDTEKDNIRIEDKSDLKCLEDKIYSNYQNKVKHTLKNTKNHRFGLHLNLGVLEDKDITEKERNTIEKSFSELSKKCEADFFLKKEGNGKKVLNCNIKNYKTFHNYCKNYLKDTNIFSEILKILQNSDLGFYPKIEFDGKSNTLIKIKKLVKISELLKKGFNVSVSNTIPTTKEIFIERIQNIKTIADMYCLD